MRTGLGFEQGGVWGLLLLWVAMSVDRLSVCRALGWISLKSTIDLGRPRAMRRNKEREREMSSS